MTSPHQQNSPTDVAYAPPPIKRSWWSRHWKWVVPVGCLTPILSCVGIITLLVTLVFGALKSSHAYRDSFATLKVDSRVTSVLGTPIEAEFWVNGKVYAGTNGGSANLQYNVSGPKGSASVHVTASEASGRWTYHTFIVYPGTTGPSIDMLANPTVPSTPANTASNKPATP